MKLFLQSAALMVLTLYTHTAQPSHHNNNPQKKSPAKTILSSSYYYVWEAEKLEKAKKEQAEKAKATTSLTESPQSSTKSNDNPQKKLPAQTILWTSYHYVMSNSQASAFTTHSQGMSIPNLRRKDSWEVEQSGKAKS